MDWLLLAYKIPREPTSSRVYVWRKLGQLGALALQDAVWVLPATRRTEEQFQWLAAEIVELHGEVRLFTSRLLLEHSDPPLPEQFEAPVRAAYESILAALNRCAPDLAALSLKYQQAKDRDYFRCELGDKVRTKLLSARRKT